MNIFKTGPCSIASSNIVLSMWLLEIFLLREMFALSIHNNTDDVYLECEIVILYISLLKKW